VAAVAKFHGDDQAEASIRRIARCPASPAYVRAYFSDPRFAGADFDAMGPNPTNAFSYADLLALNLLDVRVGPIALRKLLSGAFDDLLRALPSDLDLWSPAMEVGGKNWNDALNLYNKILKIPGMGRTKTSKLLARKRPNLIPIHDSIIERELLLKKRYWAPLRNELLAVELRESIIGFAPSIEISVLRKFDIAVWMHGSRSKNAIEVRSAIAPETLCTCPK